MHHQEISAPPGDAPKNVILVIGDGMGLSQIAVHVLSMHEHSVLESFPVIGLQKTHSANRLVTDSGASGTAMSCGIKTFNSAVGVTADTMPCVNLFALAEDAGKATGVIVTSSLVHATPASFIAHEPLRGFRERIAADFLDLDIDYIVGGGLMYFRNRYSDDRDLWQEFTDRGYTVCSYKQKGFRKFAQELYSKAVYFTAWDDPLPAFQGRQYFAWAIDHALRSLDGRDNGFFMMIEASQIDFAGHGNNLEYLFSEMNDLEDGLRELMSFAVSDKETLLIVTADHATAGLFIDEGKPGKGRLRADFTTKNHSAEMVPVFAFGPQAETFAGIYENTDIFYKIRAAGQF